MFDHAIERLVRRSPLFRAAHRIMFFCGFAQALLTMAWWAIDLGARRAGYWDAPPMAVPTPWLHAFLTIYGVFPLFVFGFILTAGPRWQGADETPPGIYLPAGLCLITGWSLHWVGLGLSSLVIPALLLIILGWVLVVSRVWSIVFFTTEERHHILIVALALSCGLLGLAAWLGYLVLGIPLLAVAALHIGLWCVLVPVFVTVLHRMLPFFSANVIRGYIVVRPLWALWLVLLTSLLHGVLPLFGMSPWIWLADVPAAFAAFHLSFLWRLKASLVSPILAVLHVGFLWCGIGFALYALHGILLLAGHPGLGLAPLHAISIGFMASTMLGMVTRVVQGHSGQQVAGGNVMWWSFWALQAATLLRMAAEFIRPSDLIDLSLLAVLIWLAAVAVWAGKYAPATWRARPDGRPG